MSHDAKSEAKPEAKDQAEGRCPPLPPEVLARRHRARALNAPGHDGEPPQYEAPHDPDGAGKRDLPERENINISRIRYLYRRGRLEARQHEAGTRLQRDWELSRIDPFASTVVVGAGGANDLPMDRKVNAMRRHGAARDALGRNWPIVELVVEREMSVEKASAMLKVHRQTGLGLLWASLHVLADHYGLA